MHSKFWNFWVPFAKRIGFLESKLIELFRSIVSKAKTIQVITFGISGNGSGSLLLMYAELQALSLLVPKREAYFLHCCQQNVYEGTWTIVDFPVDGLQDGIRLSLIRHLRTPSSCVIPEMPNGYSKVVWVEHAEVEDKPVYQIFSQFISILQRQHEWLASLMARNISDLGGKQLAQNVDLLQQESTHTAISWKPDSLLHN
ncbi:hypothetical protein HPP92_003315 [Vanilla planifolia]|uniref:START domain-containing protein n=1 Tax=Vanilla planifolia TaxID=51239 RepID=A0A835VFC3_VANPL|nr:hypothetical protein HPP92_003315 [Vanilla planifolia]